MQSRKTTMLNKHPCLVQNLKYLYGKLILVIQIVISILFLFCRFDKYYSICDL